MRYFICKNEKCSHKGDSVAVSESDFGLLAGEPECPHCGDKDSFQPADQVRTHLPESLQTRAEHDRLCDRLSGLDGCVADCQHPLAIQHRLHREGRPSFVVKDSGKHQDFVTGARRDTQDGKGDFSKMPMSWLHQLARELQRLDDPLVRLDLVPVEMLCRLARVYGAGGIKYDEGNYMKGINLSRSISSKERHAIAWAEGDETEDHLAQEAWNCFTLMWTQEAVRRGELPPEIGDYGPLLNNPGHRTNQKTGLSKEPGGEPIIPLREGVKCKALTGKRLNDVGFDYVVVRRAGAVVMGWILSSHLEAI